MIDDNAEDLADELIDSVIVGRYHVIKLLGEGGMGKVYLAEQKMGTASRKVAIKTLRPEFSMDKQIVARFMRECETVIELHHPNTVQFYDFGELPNKTLFIVMEYIAGEDLAHILERGAIDVERIDRILIQICGSLHEAHQRGIVHRDLKPENILLTQRGGQTDFVKVLDFGIAKRGEAEEDSRKTKLTKQGMILGTPPYMSPEQFSGQTLDNRSDVYSLGMMTYEMVTNHFPFEANTPWEWATKHMIETPMPIENFQEGLRLPENKRRAIMRSLSKKREERQSSVLEFMHEFTGFGDPQAAWTMATSGVSQAVQSYSTQPQSYSSGTHNSPHPISTPAPMHTQNQGGQSYGQNVPSYGGTSNTYATNSSPAMSAQYAMSEPVPVSSHSSVGKFLAIVFVILALGVIGIGLLAFVIFRESNSEVPQPVAEQDNPPINTQPPIENSKPDASTSVEVIADAAVAVDPVTASNLTNTNDRSHGSEHDAGSTTTMNDSHAEPTPPSPHDAQLAAMAQTINRQLSNRDLDGAINTFLQAQNLAPARNHPTLSRARGQISAYGDRIIGSQLLGGANGCASAKATYAKLRRISAERRASHHFGDWCRL